MRTFLKCFFSTIVFLTILVTLLVSRQPVISEVEVVSGQMVKQAHATLGQLREQLINSSNYIRFNLPEHEINSMLTIANDLIGVQMRVNLGDSAGLLVIQLEVPFFRRPVYVNGFCYLGTISGSLIDNCSLGRVPVNAAVVETAISQLVGFIGGSESMKVANSFFSNVKVRNSSLQGVVAKSEFLGDDLRSKKQQLVSLSKAWFQKESVPSSAVSYYVNSIQQIPQLENNLSAYISYVFKEASQSPNGLSPVKENEAALWALAATVGSKKFGDMVGIASSSYTMRTTQIRGRFDLSLHYVYSIAMELTSNTSVSNKIGLFKELLDSEGGSGFSFDDLMADRAGTKLAYLSTLDNETATNIQKWLTDHEPTLLPTVELEYNQLQRKEFETIYRGVASDEFKAKIQYLDDEISKLAMFQSMKKN